MYQILIVEDDTIQQNALSTILTHYNENFLICTASDFNSALDCISNTHFDIIFLDLKLDEELNTPTNGLQLGIKIRSISGYQFTPIVFITSIPELIQQALNETGCFRYILKPYTDDDIIKCLDNLLHSPLVAPPSFSFTSFYGGKLRIPENSILYFCTAANHRIHIETVDGSYETTDYTLEQLEHLLSYGFFRCHRKYLINLEHITDYDKTRRIVYLNDETIPLGRSSKAQMDEIWRMKNV